MLVLPGTCPLCGTVCTGERFCPDCHNDILHSMQNHPYRCARCCLALPNAGPCPDCSEQALHTGTVIAAFDYVHPLDSLVLRYKNGRQLDLAPAFAQLLSQQLQQRGLLPLTNTCLIPIPGSRQSLSRRGFNPAAEFAQQLGKKLQLPVEHFVLHRHDQHLKQSSLSRHARRATAAGLYYCSRRLDIPHAILVDDIVTTCSTLDSATRALLAAGVQRVDALAIARTPPNHF
ncbi:ComF family protein [Advenella alkanexedens]|uniref:ComF family protein n=1 Tax=Advenella alkanexedens TaxID=1481665 RepID=A0ABS6NKZ6_9BURK|nr:MULTISPECIES: ComF family protein [Advenella]MBV4396297.1 ComF family protein [Advenella alkanexedens]MDD3757480.1 ComF family protein [Advenella sp.]NLN67520.1 ComF family protein [Alcaligenaceae bacterium]